jgi:hypothetical protein
MLVCAQRGACEQLMPRSMTTPTGLTSRQGGRSAADRESPGCGALTASTDPAEAEQLDRLIGLFWDRGGSETATAHLDRGLSATIVAGDGPVEPRKPNPPLEIP